MAAPARFALFPPDVTFQLSRASRRALCALTRGALDDVDPSDALAFAAALFTRRFDADAAALLDDVARFGDEAAREALIEGALDRAMDPSPWLALSAADVGARAARRSLRGRAWKAVVTRAHVRLGRRLAPRAWYEVALGGESSRRRPGVIAEAGREVHGAGFVGAFEADTEDGALHVAIVHDGPAVRYTSRAADGRARTRLDRPLMCDVVRWDAARGRVSFALARPPLLPAWKHALEKTSGARLSDDRPSWTLKVLHELGSAALSKASLPRPILSVEIVACELDDGTRFGVRGGAALDTLHARLGHGGYVYRATFRFRIEGAPRPVDATVELPDKLRVGEPRWASEIRAALDALGVTASGALADDLASLAPFVHPEWRWVKVLGRADFERAIAAGILVRVRSRRAGEARHRVWGSMYTAHDLDGEDDKYAVADDPAARAHTVKAEALEQYQLDEAALVAVLRDGLVLEPFAHGSAEGPSDGVLPIGVLVAKSARLAFFLLVAVVPEAECARVREAVRKACPKGHTPVVLVGEGRTLHGGIAEVPVSVVEQLGAPSVVRAVVEAARVTRIEDELTPWRFGTPGAPVVVMREAREVWLGRVRLALTSAQVDAVIFLALERGEWVTPLALGQALSPRATWHDQIARKTLADLDARIAKSFSEAGVTLPAEWAEKLVEMKKGKGYRVGLGVVVR